MSEKAKPNKPVYYTLDFKTALPPAECRQRFERAATQQIRGIGSGFTPITQRVVVRPNNQFIIERSFPGALHAIRLVGSFDPDPDTYPGGTWVHGAITHDSENQVIIEGLIVFLLVFFLTALLFLRLKAESFVISGAMLVMLLTIMTIRWRALRSATEDMPRWIRRRLYVTPDQIRRNGAPGVDEAAAPDSAEVADDDTSSYYDEPSHAQTIRDEDGKKLRTGHEGH